MGSTLESLSAGFPFGPPPLRSNPERTLGAKSQAIEEYLAKQHALNEVLKEKVLELYASSGVIDALRDTVTSGPLFVLHEVPGFRHKISSEATISFRQEGNSFCFAQVAYDNNKNRFRSPWQEPDFGRKSAVDILEKLRKLDTIEGIRLLRCNGNFRFGFWGGMAQIDFWFGKVNVLGERELFLAEEDRHSEAVVIPEEQWDLQRGKTICEFVEDIAFPFFS